MARANSRNRGGSKRYSNTDSDSSDDEEGEHVDWETKEKRYKAEIQKRGEEIIRRDEEIKQKSDEIENLEGALENMERESEQLLCWQFEKRTMEIDTKNTKKGMSKSSFSVFVICLQKL